VTPRILVERILEALRPSRAKAYRGQRGVGQRWEAIAAKRLRREGYVLKERNFRARAGEIDLVAEENGVLCFIEVKGRRGEGFGTPAEAVTLEKQRRIARAAEEYLALRRLGAPPCRFDVVAILESEQGTEITILRNAFEQPPESRTHR
jgi:putative endonuclease